MKIRTFLTEHFFNLRVILRIQCFKMSRQLNLSLSSKATSLLRQSDARCPLNQDFLFRLTLIGTRHEFTVNILKRRNRKWRKIKWFNILAICKK